MSKYYKAEDVEAVLAEKHMNRPLDSDRWVIGDIGKSIADLPTIEVSEDCISREQVIEAIDEVDWYHVGFTGELVHGATSDDEAWYKAEDIYKAIKSVAPSVVPQAKEGEWIPCSERLPKKDGSYLVCMSWNYLSMDVLMWADGWNCTRRINGEVNRESEMDEEIIAWMPLPEPWKGANDE